MCSVGSRRRGGISGRPKRLSPCSVRRFEVERKVVGEGDLEEHLAGPPRVAEPVEKGQGSAVLDDCFFLRVDRARGVAGFQQVARSPLGLVCLGEVASQQAVRPRELVGV